MIEVEFKKSDWKEVKKSASNNKINDAVYVCINKIIDCYIENNLISDFNEFDIKILRKITINKLESVFYNYGVEVTRFKSMVDLLNVTERVMIWSEKPQNFEKCKNVILKKERKKSIDNLLKK